MIFIFISWPTGVGVHRRSNHVFEYRQKKITKSKPCKIHVVFDKYLYNNYLQKQKIEEKKSLLWKNPEKKVKLVEI